MQQALASTRPGGSVGYVGSARRPVRGRGSILPTCASARRSSTSAALSAATDRSRVRRNDHRGRCSIWFCRLLKWRTATAQWTSVAPSKRCCVSDDNSSDFLSRSVHRTICTSALPTLSHAASAPDPTRWNFDFPTDEIEIVVRHARPRSADAIIGGVLLVSGDVPRCGSREMGLVFVSELCHIPLETLEQHCHLQTLKRIVVAGRR